MELPAYIPKINFVKCNSSPPYRGWRLLAKILLNKWLKNNDTNLRIHEITIDQDGDIHFEMDDYLQVWLYEDVEKLAKKIKDVITEGEVYLYFTSDDPVLDVDYGFLINDKKVFLIKPKTKWDKVEL
ncbi:MAG: hypothetical protein QXX30_00920 [Candidatus Aenigmatarchaeota archaeon]